jgi:glutaredoxin 3
MSKVTMYCTRICPYCQQAQRLLKLRGVEEIEKVYIDKEPARKTEMTERTGRRTVPQIYIGDTYVGGFDDLALLDSSGGLTRLLETTVL